LVSIRQLLAGGAVALSLLAAPMESRAAGTLAGVDINNTAQVTYDVGGASTTTNSNTVTVRVAEILDVRVQRQSPADVSVAPGATQRAIHFRVVNFGNASETFRLTVDSTVGADDFNPVPSSPAIYLDLDQSGDLSTGDVAYAAGTNDPVLAADAVIDVLVFNDIPGSATDNQVGTTRLTADARTGSGAPGLVFAGQGQSGTDAVVGSSGALAFADGTYRVNAVTLSAVKSQSVADTLGGNRPLPLATITYTIVVSASGTGSATNAVFTDDIPANTTYVANSLTLNGAALTDAADADAGFFESTPGDRVRVVLGNVTSAATQTIQFAVTID
jgi:uncharacterized repeat protein (TIGR01451 family)